MASLTTEAFLTCIALAGPQINSSTLDAAVKDAIECAHILADGFLKFKATGIISKETLSAGAELAASLFVVGCNLKKIIIRIVKNDSHEQFKHKYENFAKFIEDIKSETEKKIEEINVLSQEVKKDVLNIGDVEQETLHAFIDSVKIKIGMIENQIECCKNDIALGVEKIKKYLNSTAFDDANDQDKMGSILRGIAGSVLGGVAGGAVGGVLAGAAGAVVAVACLPVVLPVAGVVTGIAAIGLNSVSEFQKRKGERNEFKRDLELEEDNFDLMKLKLGNHELCLKVLKEEAEKYRKHAPPAL